MKPVVVSISAAEDSDPVVVNNYSNPVNIGLAVTFGAGAAGTAKVQYSLDDPFASYSTGYTADATWFTASGLSSVTSATYGAITTPIRAVKLTATSVASGTIYLTVVQAGIVGP